MEGAGVVDSLKIMDYAEQSFNSKIIADDELVIIVSAEDPAAVAHFNLPVVSVNPSGNTNIAQTQQLQSYIVDSEGEITFPVLGRLKIAGLSRKEAENLIRAGVEGYVNNPIVTISQLNKQFNILGDVASPGPKVFQKDRLTILEAIALAGDMNITARRDNILVAREENGKRNFYRVDISQPDFFTSPAYYIKRNDVIYVEPNENQKAQAEYDPLKSTNIAVVSTTLSGISIITTLVMAFTLK